MYVVNRCGAGRRIGFVKGGVAERKVFRTDAWSGSFSVLWAFYNILGEIGGKGGDGLYYVDPAYPQHRVREPERPSGHGVNGSLSINCIQICQVY